MLSLKLIFTVSTLANLWILAFCQDIQGTLTLLNDDVLSGPVTFDFLTPSTIAASGRTSLSFIDLRTGHKTLLAGSETIGGYVDGNSTDARFSLINDVVVQGNYIYIADYSCVRIYDIERKLVATLSGVCGRIEETPNPSLAPPVFKGHLKLAVSARDLYVLDDDRVSRVDRETGVVWVLSMGELLADGRATSIEIDGYTNTLLVEVLTGSEVNIVGIDIITGRQSLLGSIRTSSTDGVADMTVTVASLDIAPDGTIYVVEPRFLHTIDLQTKNVVSRKLENYGYHEVAVSSEYLVISQEYYSRMYRLHLMKIEKNIQTKNLEQFGNKAEAISAGGDRDQTYKWTKKFMFQPQTFYLAIVLPSVLFILLIIVTVCAARKILRQKSEKKYVRPTSDASSEKYFLNQEGLQDSRYWM